jgi:aminopeptidase YwaD
MLADGTTSEGAPITLEIPLKPKDRNDQQASPLGEIAVYPIPAQNLLFVELPENERIETITLMDLQGKVLLSQSDFNSNQTRLNIAELNNGMYILTAKTASDIRMTKVQILR